MLPEGGSVVGQSGPKYTTLHTRKIDLAAKGGATSPVPIKTHIAKTPTSQTATENGDKLTKHCRKQQRTPSESTGTTSSADPRQNAGGRSIELKRRCAWRGAGIARTVAARRDIGRRKETKLGRRRHTRRISSRGGGGGGRDGGARPR